MESSIPDTNVTVFSGVNSTGNINSKEWACRSHLDEGIDHRLSLRRSPQPTFDGVREEVSNMDGLLMRSILSAFALIVSLLHLFGDGFEFVHSGKPNGFVIASGSSRKTRFILDICFVDGEFSRAVCHITSIQKTLAIPFKSFGIRIQPAAILVGMWYSTPVTNRCLSSSESPLGRRILIQRVNVMRRERMFNMVAH